MTTTKLTAPQQRVLDWLTEKPGRYLTVNPITFARYWYCGDGARAKSIPYALVQRLIQARALQGKAIRVGAALPDGTINTGRMSRHVVVVRP